MIRQAAVAGSFYPADSISLRAQLEAMLPPTHAPRHVRGIILPHAGYIYSGRIAGAVLAQIEIPAKVILLGPNHTGAGSLFSLSGATAWQTPLGAVPVAAQLRDKLLKRIAYLDADNLAHCSEHSLEVMLPFLQYLRPDVEILPLTLACGGLDEALDLGNDLAAVLVDEPDDFLLLASSDMNHFSSAAVTEKLDRLAIDALCAYDLPQLYSIVREKRISMCGLIPALAVMQAAQQLGAQSCELVEYAHSGQVNGDNSRVVGYAGLILN
jgi:AmmeMemoRadiSam system protein B